jgi:hypothetical protein
MTDESILKLKQVVNWIAGHGHCSILGDGVVQGAQRVQKRPSCAIASRVRRLTKLGHLAEDGVGRFTVTVSGREFADIK